MKKIAVVYWSGTGHTEEMAQQVAAGIQEAGVNPEIIAAAGFSSSLLRGKPIALFGSYGWGDGEWMQSWEDSCTQGGAILSAASVICQEAPDEEAVASCKALGRALAES